jgi:hypothetical protein
VTEKRVWLNDESADHQAERGGDHHSNTRAGLEHPVSHRPEGELAGSESLHMRDGRSDRVADLLGGIARRDAGENVRDLVVAVASVVTNRLGERGKDVGRGREGANPMGDPANGGSLAHQFRLVADPGNTESGQVGLVDEDDVGAMDGGDLSIPHRPRASDAAVVEADDLDVHAPAIGTLPDVSGSE